MKKISSFTQNLSLQKHSAFLSVLCYLLIYAAIIFSGHAKAPSFSTWYLKIFVLFFASVLFILSLGNHTSKRKSKSHRILPGVTKKTEDKVHAVSPEKSEPEVFVHSDFRAEN